MIEEYWQDGFIYYVTFIGKHSNLKFTRALIFSHEKSTKDIEQAVFNKFKDVRAVTYIEEVDTVLVLKEEFQIS